MRTRGAIAAGIAAAALLSGCASFADRLNESAAAAAAATTSTAASSSAAATSSGAPAAAATSSAPSTTGGAAASTTVAVPPPAVTTSAAPPAAAAVSWPPETTISNTREVYGVYLAAATTYTAAETAQMKQVYSDLQALGYRGYSGPLCDAGAEAAGVDESGDAVVVYFSTSAAAQQFIAGWKRPYVGVAKVATFCN